MIDTHSDTTPYFEREDWDFAARHDGENAMDLPRIREGGLDVEFWSIYMGKVEGDGRAIREALERIDAVHHMASMHDDVVLAGSVEEIRAGVAAGKFVSVMGVEGGHIIEDSLAALRNYYRLGVRYLTLTHSFHTAWADSSGTTQDLEPKHNGLTPFGEDIVREMNRLGMMVDISHVADATFFDVLAISRAPVIASHSSCRGVTNHRRNMSDEMLRALAENGGVIMINFYPGYIDDEATRAITAYFKAHSAALAAFGKLRESDLDAYRAARAQHIRAYPVPQSSFEILLQHFDHAIRVAGPDHVGLGADWDGVPSMPEGMEEIDDLPKLTEALLSRGHSQETVRKVLGENLLRVMRANELVAERLASVQEIARPQRAPTEDDR